MKKMYAMIMTAAMAASTLAPATAFAADPPHEYTNWTVTDIDVEVAGKGEGYGDQDLSEITENAPDMIQEVVEERDPNVATQIYVEVEWSAMNFTYDFGTVAHYVWNVETLTYDIDGYNYVNGEGPGWINPDGWIKFWNHSNSDVWVGASFESNKEPGIYDNVDMLFPEGNEVNIESAVGKGGKPVLAVLPIQMTGEPDITILDYPRDEIPALGKMKFYISEESREYVPEPEPEVEEVEDGEHEHHWVYDQFGRLVCTGCNEVQHEYCVDFDEDGLCDECGLERDFCEDCHVGGKCVCT